jgi:hypothetical protein
VFCQFYVLSNIGLVDSSGMRITYTSELREYDVQDLDYIVRKYIDLKGGYHVPLKYKILRMIQ